MEEAAKNLVGKVVNNIRRTEDGFVDEDTGWWFFQRTFPDKVGAYWYAKKRTETGSVQEEYVGVELPFSLPKELMTNSEYVRYVEGDLIIEPEHDLRDNQDEE